MSLMNAQIANIHR